MNNTGFWLPVYHYNLFGDPALRQYGRLVGIQEIKTNIQPLDINIFPNPSRRNVSIHFGIGKPEDLDITVYDSCGRIVRFLNNTSIEKDLAAIDLDLPAGVYFIDLRSNNVNYRNKIVIIK
jgi:hypothetical protein